MEGGEVELHPLQALAELIIAELAHVLVDLRDAEPLVAESDEPTGIVTRHRECPKPKSELDHTRDVIPVPPAR